MSVMLHRTAANRAAYNESGNAFVLIGSEDSGVTFSALILVDGVSTVVYFHVLNLFHELVVSLDDLCACHFLSERIMKVITMIANRPIITTAAIADARERGRNDPPWPGDHSEEFQNGGDRRQENRSGDNDAECFL